MGKGRKASTALGVFVKIPAWQTPQVIVDAMKNVAASQQPAVSVGMMLSRIFSPYVTVGQQPAAGDLPAVAVPSIGALLERFALQSAEVKRLEAELTVARSAFATLRAPAAGRRPLPSLDVLAGRPAFKAVPVVNPSPSLAPLQTVVVEASAIPVSAPRVESRIAEFDNVILSTLSTMGESASVMIPAWLAKTKHGSTWLESDVGIEARDALIKKWQAANSVSEAKLMVARDVSGFPDDKWHQFCKDLPELKPVRALARRTTRALTLLYSRERHARAHNSSYQ